MKCFYNLLKAYSLHNRILLICSEICWNTLILKDTYCSTLWFADIHIQWVWGFSPNKPKTEKSKGNQNKNDTSSNITQWQAVWTQFNLFCVSSTGTLNKCTSATSYRNCMFIRQTVPVWYGKSLHYFLYQQAANCDSKNSRNWPRHTVFGC